MSADIHVCWNWMLQSRPAELWPWISNTDRFNRDSAVPSVEQMGQSRYRKLLSLEKLGVRVEWEEEPFEWVRPSRFGVLRRYRSGPLEQMRVLAELSERPEGGTHVRYQVWAAPRNWLAGWLVRLQLLESSWRFRSTVRRYDRAVASHAEDPALESRLGGAARQKLAHFARRLETAGADPVAIGRLTRLIETGDDPDVAVMRPYALADRWGLGRRPVLEAFLHAASLGMLDIQWDLLCPLCRGAKQTASSLDNVNSNVHCDACQIDFSVNFDRSVEATFRPAASIRPVDVSRYCVGGPQTQPHIVAQQVLPARSSRTFALALETGPYRFRRWGSSGGQIVRVGEGATASVELDAESRVPVEAARQAQFHVENRSSEEQMVLLERLAWSDQAATAAEVTSLQLFRDLFSTEALRPAEPFDAGTLTLLVTAFHDPVAAYERIGDTAAFAAATRHQQTVIEAVSKRGGAFVRSTGDGTLSVFREPAPAIAAAREAIERFEGERLTLKAAVHTGPVLAVTLNERLDYFGAAVRMAEQMAADAPPGGIATGAASETSVSAV